MDQRAPDLNDVPGEWTPVFQIELNGLSAPQQARWMIREQLSGTVSVSFLRDIMLATSELVTNAVRYAPGPCRVSMSRSSGSARIRIGVSDTNRQFPKPIAPTDPLMNGRGLLIVDTVASAWGTRLVDASVGKWSKEVWFEMLPDQRSQSSRLIDERNGTPVRVWSFRARVRRADRSGRSLPATGQLRLRCWSW